MLIFDQLVSGGQLSQAGKGSYMYSRWKYAYYLWTGTQRIAQV